MAAPALAGLLVFVALPFALSFALSFTNLRLGSPLPVEWVGLEQYRRIFYDASFNRALLNNALFALGVVPIQTALALALALALEETTRGNAVLRSVFFMPVVFPMALVAVVWELIYAPGPGGLFNAAMEFFTLGAWRPRDVLGSSALALPALMALSIWQGLGFQMIILIAGLQSIPKALYEAAEVDGAGRWQRFRYITLPQLRRPLVFVVMVTAILSFRLFDQVQILTGGGPQDATTTVMFEAYRAAFERQQIGRGAAMSVVFFVIVLALTLIALRIMSRGREEAP